VSARHFIISGYDASCRPVGNGGPLPPLVDFSGRNDFIDVAD
jgi:hypothetical protein